MSELFAAIQAAGGVREEVSDRGWLQAMLDAEAALAGALADTGRLEPSRAAAIAAVCRTADYDAAALGAAAVGAGNPVVPLVRAVIDRVGGEAAASVHSGATSQDIVDTAMMLVARRSLDVLRADLAGCLELVATLARDHVDSVQAGRTLLQQAAPTTFGLTAAGWLSGLLRADEALVGAGAALAVQLGGAVGTLAAYGEGGSAVVAAMASRLGLVEPRLPWHTERSRVAALAGALGQTAGTVAMTGRSITLLAQTEVAELVEEGPTGTGGSSTLPHKRNPIAAVLAVSCAAQAPGLVATLLGSMGQELQRAAGGWHAEWRALSELLLSTGSAVHWLRTSLSRLRVDAERMRRTVDAGAEALTAERVSGVLIPVLGRAGAQDLVADCVRRAASGAGSLVDLLVDDPRVAGRLDRVQLAELADPSAYLGSAAAFTRRVVDDYLQWKDQR